MAGVCLVGLFLIGCFGCLNTVAVEYMRKYNVLIAKETHEDLACDQSRVS